MRQTGYGFLAVLHASVGMSLLDKTTLGALGCFAVAVGWLAVLAATSREDYQRGARDANQHIVDQVNMWEKQKRAKQATDEALRQRGFR